ncbi:EAL domain-containing protein [Ectothiorhodospiraceae bacterium 2226]|nr:EAL domain-containing protein [Ectothiorhodospiraceae bacterium 2226]
MNKPETDAGAPEGGDDHTIAEREAFVGLGAEDRQHLRALRERLAPPTRHFIERFYSDVDRFEPVRALIARPEVRKRLKHAHVQYFDDLLAADFGPEYVLGRLRVGERHHQIGLDPKWYIGAYARYLSHVAPDLLPSANEEDVRALQALTRAVFMDIGLALDAYSLAERRAGTDFSAGIICTLPVAVLAVSSSLRVLHANRAAGELLQLDHAAMAGRLLLDLPALAPLKEPVTQLDISGEVPDLPLLEGPGGRWLDARLMRWERAPSPTHDSIDACALVVMLEDVTERERLRGQAEAAAARNQTIVTLAPDGIVIIDALGTIQTFNHAAEKMFGYQADEVIGKNVSMLMPSPHRENHDAYLADYHGRRGKPLGVNMGYRELMGQRKDGQVFPLELAVSEVALDDGTGFIGTLRDIEERKRTEADLQHSRRRLAEAQRIARLGNWYWNVDTGYLHWSDELYRIFGLKRHAGAPTLDTYLALLHPQDRAGVEAKLQQALDGGPLYESHHRILRSDGTVRWIHVRGEITRAMSRRAIHVVGTVQDVTERHEAQEQMRKLSSAVEQTADIVSITDHRGRIEYVNAAFESVTGYTRAEAIGRKPSMVSSGKHSHEFYVNVWETLLRGEPFREVFINRRKSGELYYEEKTITPLRNSQGEVTHFVSTGKDITERMQAQERLHFLAHYDPLTGLPNRALFMDRMERALARARRTQSNVCVMFLDMDRFKLVNDSFGHTVGDGLLRDFALRLQDTLRETDTAARFGGDEFVILLEDIKCEADAEAVAAKLLASLTHPFRLEEREFYATVSVGVCCSSQGGQGSAELLKNADAAMYRAKNQGRNRYAFFEPEMDVGVHQRLELEGALRRALDHKEFELEYQPIVDATGKVLALEALLRWRRADGVQIAPLEFIPLLEDTGLIVPVGEWVLATACQAKKGWEAAGFHELDVAVNISAAQFEGQALAATVERILGEQGVEPANVHLEITESLLMRDLPRALETMGALHALGVQLAVDDFGTGYSSLNYLKRFPIRSVKVDRTFVQDIVHDANDHAIVAAVLHMCESLGLTAVAEGVENAEQLELLRRLGCSHMQGFYFARPLAASAVLEYLQRASRGAPGAR